MTKKQEQLLNNYKRATLTELYQCYANPSQAKRNAYVCCRGKCYGMGGFGFKICGYNCTMFSVGWLYPNPETGVIMLHYETYRNTWDFEVPASQL